MSRKPKALRRAERTMDLYSFESDDYIETQPFFTPTESKDRRTFKPGYSKPRKPPITLTSSEYIKISSQLIVHPMLSDNYLSNPDVSVPTKAILRLVMPSAECPICLETARVPRMLECGHLLCLVCFHRYKQEVDPIVCPICVVPVSKRTIPVSIVESDDRFLPQVGHEVALRLVTRTKNSLLRYCSDEQSQQKTKTRIPSVDENLSFAQSRLVKASSGYLEQELANELKILESDRLESLAVYSDDSGFSESISEIQDQLKLDFVGQKVDLPPPPPVPQTGSPQDQFFYYQTCFESLVTYLLSPLDVSVLKATFGEYSSFPPSLVVKVENVTHMTLCESDRKRLKFLSHLPLHSPLAFLECDWRSIMSAEAAKTYGAKLSKRRRNKSRKDHIDEHNRVTAQSKDDAEMKAQVLESLPQITKLNLRNTELPTLGGQKQATKPAAATPKWDYNKADRAITEALVENAFVTKRGRKRVVLLD